MREIDHQMKEGVEYRDVVGFPGYKVGNDGTVWSCRVGGRWKQLNTKYRNDGTTYVVMGLYRDGKCHCRLAHRLVLEAFVGPKPEGMECCHNDGNPRNNNLSNLRWDTREANYRDYVSHKTNGRGKTHCCHGHLLPEPVFNGKVRCKRCLCLRDLKRQRRWQVTKVSGLVRTSGGLNQKICRGAVVHKRQNSKSIDVDFDTDRGFVKVRISAKSLNRLIERMKEVASE